MNEILEPCGGRRGACAGVASSPSTDLNLFYRIGKVGWILGYLRHHGFMDEPQVFD